MCSICSCVRGPGGIKSSTCSSTVAPFACCFSFLLSMGPRITHLHQHWQCCSEDQSGAGDGLGSELHANMGRANSSQSVADHPTCQFWFIAIQAEVAQVELPQFRGNDLFNQVGCAVIGKMPVPAQNALLQTPGASQIVLQHFQ